MSPTDTARPSVSMASTVGTYPIGVSTAGALPATRWKIHSSTREFSP
jgi:hypothetical protein